MNLEKMNSAKIYFKIMLLEYNMKSYSAESYLLSILLTCQLLQKLHFNTRTYWKKIFV